MSKIVATDWKQFVAMFKQLKAGEAMSKEKGGQVSACKSPKIKVTYKSERRPSRKVDLSGCITPLSVHTIMWISLLSFRRRVGTKRTYLYST